MPTGFRSRVPAKITSSMRAPRRLLADCSPSTQEMASLMLDLPQPFGPTIAAMPSPLKRSSVRSQNDLKPCTSTRLSLSKALPHGFGGSCNHTKRVCGKSKVAPPLHIGLFAHLTQYMGRSSQRRPFWMPLFPERQDSLPEVGALENLVPDARGDLPGL